MGREGYYVWDVFSEEDARHFRFVDAVIQHHRDTGQPIFLPAQKKRQKPHTASALRGRLEALAPQHLELVRACLPRRVVREARAAYYRDLYQRLKLKVLFVREALSQMRAHDPFSLTMDDVHDADAALTSMTSWMVYYTDQMVF